MLVSRLVPLVVMGGIGAHSGGAIKQRLAGFLGAAETAVARQRLGAILDAAELHTVSDGGGIMTFRSQGEFRAWVQRAVRIPKKPGADASLDPWGTPLEVRMNGAIMMLSSAGPDRRSGTSDDIKSSRNLADY